MAGKVERLIYNWPIGTIGLVLLWIAMIVVALRRKERPFWSFGLLPLGLLLDGNMMSLSSPTSSISFPFFFGYFPLIVLRLERKNLRHFYVTGGSIRTSVVLGILIAIPLLLVSNWFIAYEQRIPDRWEPVILLVVFGIVINAIGEELGFRRFSK